MHFSSVMPVSTLSLFLPLLLHTLPVWGKMFDIAVGKGGLLYDPEEVTAAKGDSLVFHFYGPVHNVAQSSFDKPCQPIDNAIYSGDFEVEGEGPSDKTFTVQVNNTDPIWIYCAEETHCENGMAMVVNAP